MAIESKISRRNFLKRTAKAGAVAGLVAATSNPVFAEAETEKTEGYMGSIIDLTKCDGCPNKDTPECVLACRMKNQDRFPEPQEPMKDYWPQKRHEDYSKERERIDRLTPYNWTYVEEVEVEHQGKMEKVSIPRRCMHCLDAPCQKLCPFGVINRSEQGAVKIDEDFCMGGAKCRTVCPWEIPQRQAGVGIYLNIAPDLAGGGVMYKCDMCSDLLAKGQKPACETACPHEAIKFGPVDEIRKEAYAKAKEVNGYVYGDAENGGTLTFYVSKVPYEKINEAIQKDLEGRTKPRPAGRPHMKPDVENMLNTAQGFAMATFVAPIAGAATAGIAAYKAMKGKKDQEVDSNGAEEN